MEYKIIIGEPSGISTGKDEVNLTPRASAVCSFASAVRQGETIEYAPGRFGFALLPPVHLQDGTYLIVQPVALAQPIIRAISAFDELEKAE